MYTNVNNVVVRKKCHMVWNKTEYAFSEMQLTMVSFPGKRKATIIRQTSKERK